MARRHAPPQRLWPPSVASTRGRPGRLGAQRRVPDRVVADIGSTGPSWNEANHTVAVEFADGRRAYVKVASDGDGSRIARERAVIEHVAATGAVPVPTVLASDPEGPVPYLATAPAPGPTLATATSGAGETERAVAARAVGAALARLHRRRFDDHGRVTGGGPDDHFDRAIAAVESNRALLERAPAALLYGDPARPNCFRSGNGVGFLDWELAHVGDPVRDVHRARDQQVDSLRAPGPERVVAAFYDGYRGQADGLPDGFAERRPVYEAVRLLGVSGYFGRTAEHVDESPEELARWLRAEMDRRLADL